MVETIQTLSTSPTRSIQRYKGPSDAALAIRTDLNADLLCTGLGVGTPLLQLCRTYGLSSFMVYQWLREDPAMAERANIAREIGADALADEILPIADNEDSDPRSRKVRIQARLDLLKVWHPSKYGERIQVDSRNLNANLDVSDDPLEAARQYADAMRGR